MRIGYDAKRIVRNGTGLGSYGRNLVNSLSAIDHDDEFLLYAPDEGRDDLRSQIELRENVSFHYPKRARFRFQRDAWRTKGIVKDLVNDKVDLYHGLSGELPVGIKKAGIPTVVTIHDLIFLRHPEYYKWFDVQIYKRKFYATLKEADYIIAISECTKRDILYYGDFPEDRIKVIYQSASKKFNVTDDLPKSSLLEGVDKYILQVGTIEERKNAMESVQALEYLPKDVHLVLVGRETSYTEQVRRYASMHGLSPRLHILCGVSNDELAKIYRHAQCFVYPSRYEGFGIPIIEAIQCGLPVVAATGSCLEEAGGPDCLYVSPDDPKGMAESLSLALSQGEGKSRSDNTNNVTGASDERQNRILRTQQYVKRFENNDVAGQVLELYKHVLSTE